MKEDESGTFPFFLPYFFHLRELNLGSDGVENNRTYVCLSFFSPHYFQAKALPRHVAPPEWAQPSHLWGRKCFKSRSIIFLQQIKSKYCHEAECNDVAHVFFNSFCGVAPVRLNPFCPKRIHTMSWQFRTIWAVCNQRWCVWRYRDCACHRTRPFILSALSLILTWQRNLLSRKKLTTAVPNQGLEWRKPLLSTHALYCKIKLDYMTLVLYWVWSFLCDLGLIMGLVKQACTIS